MKGRLKVDVPYLDGKVFPKGTEVKLFGCCVDGFDYNYYEMPNGILWKIEGDKVEITDYGQEPDMREFRAKAALEAMRDIVTNRKLYNQVIDEYSNNGKVSIPDCVATAAVEFADALIRKLEERS